MLVASRYRQLLSFSTLVAARQVRQIFSYTGNDGILQSTLDEKLRIPSSSFSSWKEFESRGFKRPEHTRFWNIYEYGSPLDVLQLDTTDTSSDAKNVNINQRELHSLPSINHPNDVLINIHAASINPIDIRMCEGYGKQLFNFQRDASCLIGSILKPFKDVQRFCSEKEFPLTLGRDFSGTVVDIGPNVCNLKVGDSVYGATSLFKSGVLADYACVDQSEVVAKPVTCSHIEAASIPYAGLTVMSALHHLVINSINPKHALILGGSGGIGTLAIQYLQTYDFCVTTTCSGEGIDLCNKLGANCIDYKEQDIRDIMKHGGKYSIVFDLIGAASPELASSCLVRGGSYVTLRSPLVEMADEYGAVLGLTTSVATFVQKKLENMEINVEWGFFKPNKTALSDITNKIDAGLIRPVVIAKNIFAFDDVPKAFEVVGSGHAKGKIVINVSGLPEATQQP